MRKGAWVELKERVVLKQTMTVSHRRKGSRMTAKEGKDTHPLEPEIRTTQLAPSATVRRAAQQMTARAMVRATFIYKE